MVAVPAVIGWKVVEAEELPGAKVTGLVVMVPTGGLELVATIENGPVPGFNGSA
jgi:hypothetical protein